MVSDKWTVIQNISERGDMKMKFSRRKAMAVSIFLCTVVLIMEVAVLHRQKVHQKNHAIRTRNRNSNVYFRQNSPFLRSMLTNDLKVVDKNSQSNNSLELLAAPFKNIDRAKKKETSDEVSVSLREPSAEENYMNDDIYDGFVSIDYHDEKRRIPDLYISDDVPKHIDITRPSCVDLIQGNAAELIKSLVFAGTFPYKTKMNYNLETQNCRKFISNRGYILRESKEETGFPLAYSILMYKDVEQVERLLRAIYRPSNHYCIHIDLKAGSAVQKQMEGIVKCFPNVYMSSRRLRIQWGKFSVLEAEFICMRDLLKRPGWKYFINLTGQEFPLKTNLEIVKILKILNGTNSIDANTQPRWRPRRWQKAWPPPHAIKPYKGNVHVAVTRAFVNFALKNKKVQDFNSWLNKTTVPDETFFATLDNNPQLHTPGLFPGRISTDYVLKPYIARFKNWGPMWGEKSFDWPCRGKRVRGICIFGVGDLHLLASRRELFANKFHISFQTQTFDCIEEWHRNRTMEEYKGIFTMNYDFYKSMPQVTWRNRT